MSTKEPLEFVSKYDGVTPPSTRLLAMIRDCKRPVEVANLLGYILKSDALKKVAGALLLALVMFHRLDGHVWWVYTDKIESVEGAGQLGYPIGTLITTGSGKTRTVKENVNEVIRTLREK